MTSHSLFLILLALTPGFCQGQAGPEEKDKAASNAYWDQAGRHDAGQPVAVADGEPDRRGQEGDPGPRLTQPVNAKTIEAANQEVLALRERVWKGEIEPARFYAEAESIYVRRFGQDYGDRVRAFLEDEAKARAAASGGVRFQDMSEQDRREFFRAMPKGAELHFHLTGAIAPEVLLEIAESLNTEFATKDLAAALKKDLSTFGVDPAREKIATRDMSPELKDAVRSALVSHEGESFMDFLTKWKIIGPITKDPRAQYPLLKHVAQKAREQGILYLEIIATKDPDLLAAMAASVDRVERETGVTLRLIGYAAWNAPKDAVDAIMAASQRLSPNPVVGFNMVANEMPGPLPHYESFKKLREGLSGLSVTLHAGELPKSSPNIVNDLLLSPQRYGHATQVEETPLAMATLYANKTPVEISLISNQKTLVVSDLSRHPLPKLLAWRVPVILSTDDPGVFQSTLSQEYELAQRQFGLGWEDLKRISRDGIRHSFLAPKDKERLSRELETRLGAFEKSEVFRKYRR